MIVAERAGDALQVTLQSELTIYQVGELHAAVQPWLAQGCPWRLDLSQVAEMDGAGLQWLLFIRQHLRAGGHDLALTAASDAVCDVLQLCPTTGLARPA